MKRLLAWVIVLAGGYLIFFSGSATKKIGSKKVTIEIATPQGTVRGSSVFELTHSNAPWWYPSAVRGAFGIKGEAPYADLGDGRYVFMLLHDQFWQKRMVAYLISERDRDASSYDNTPIFVTFDNIEDVNSIRAVDRNALHLAFGAGYRLAGLTVTETKEPATQGTLAKKFPALHMAMMPSPADQTPPPSKQKLPFKGTSEEWYASLSPEEKRLARWHPSASTAEKKSAGLEPFRKDLRRIDWGAFDAIPRR
ncbi:hypothetical protein [Rhodopseudomonas palustris]|uniref:hypothetical protein n=1 Tax=Rhodopseudomonas palustris TaxID=1076 RepID=UPI0012ED33C0